MSLSGPSHVAIPLDEARSFGRYTLCAELASGGMGTVYAARASGPGGFQQLVALKRVHAHLARDPRFVDMFLDEARLAARIQHPNVCSVIDFGMEEGAYYLVMPFVAGVSFSSLRRDVHRLEDPALVDRFRWIALAILADACAGLHAAHELEDDDGHPLEVVHRDISPSNLLVGYDGACRVIDFGVASAKHRLHSTATGEVKGKLGYAAPEQLQGEKVDRRADLWSLGVVIYEVLTGRRLFSRDDAGSTVLAVTQAPVPSLREHWPEAPLTLEEITARALTRNRDRRYATARELGQALHRALVEEGHVLSGADVADFLQVVYPEGAAEARGLFDVEPTTPLVPAPRVSAIETPPAPGRGRGLAVLVAVTLAAGIAGTLAFRAWAESEPATVGSGSEMDPEEEPGVEREPPEPEPPGPEAPEIPVDPVATTETPAPVEPPVEAPVEAPAQSPAESTRPTNRRSASARGDGSVRVVPSSGWAYVYLGERRLGEAPGTFTLPAGSHTLGIQPMGRGPKERRRVRVRPGAATLLRLP